MEDIILAEYSATCVMTNCENQGISITLLADASSPVIWCGVCGQQIADIALLGALP